MKSLFFILLIAFTLYGSESEKMFWDEVKDSNDIELLKLYKKNYPNGIFESLADIKIKRLKKVDTVQYAKPIVPTWLKGYTSKYRYYGVGKANKHFKGKQYQRSLAIKRAKRDLENKFEKYNISTKQKEQYLEYLSTKEYIGKREKIYILLYVDNDNL